MMTEDPQLLKRLIDEDELEDIEVQKGGYPAIVKGRPIKTSSSKKKTKSRKGCPCWCKCIGFTVLTFIFFVILAMAYGYKVLTEVVEELTIETDTPRKFPVVTMSEPELDAVANRVKDFFENIIDGKADTTYLVLSQDEINGFIGHSDYLRGNLMYTLHQDQIVEEFSLPMDVLGFDGRYFAGYESFALGTLNSEGEDGYDKKNIVEMKMTTEAKHEDWFDGPLMFMQLQYLITKNKEDEGQKVFELFLEKGCFFGSWIEPIEERHNIMEDIYDGADSEDFRKVVNGIERVSIQEGRVIIKARNPSIN
jgi:hypothetical protein